MVQSRIDSQRIRLIKDRKPLPLRKTWTCYTLYDIVSYCHACGDGWSGYGL